jgi:hypothetical protein
VWSDADDEILAGDLTAALAYTTPARGAVVTPVAPIGQRDRAAARVTFTTSLGFGRKLDRIKSDPCVALAYHAREHGFAGGTRFVLVQGRARYEAEPDRAALERLQPDITRFMGPRQTGVFWDRWLSAYYADRVLVDVSVERTLSWADAAAAGEPAVSGAPLPGAPASQAPPRNGTGPRIDVQRAVRRIAKLPHVLLSYVGADGFPLVMPVSVGVASAGGIALRGPLPGGARRAGLLAHRYEAKLIGLEVRQYTGWLDGDNYAPHTERGFRAPANKTILLLANGFMARRGLRQARAAGRA